MRRRTVAVTGMLLAALAASACDGPSATDPAVDEPSAPEAAEVADEAPITLAFAGDVHFERHLQQLLDRPGVGLGPIGRTLADADLAMVNLESAITDGGTPDPKELEDPGDRYWFRTGPAALEVLAAAGVDVVTMANNHGADYGAAGFADTLRAAAQGPVAVVGVGEDQEEAFRPHRATVGGTDVAVLAADASVREGRSTLWAAGAATPGIAAARGTRTGALLDAVRAAAAVDDVVVVYLHWGVEYRTCPDPAQQRLATALSEAGADVVVGSHTHVLQGAGWLGGTYVGYGLGNFVWYHNAQADTGVLELQVAAGRVMGADWVAAAIGKDGLPRRVRGETAIDADRRWAALRPCTGLSDRPTTGPGPQTDPPAAPYASSVRAIGPALRARMASSRQPGCPVAWADLRHLRVPYVGFDGADRLGELVVHARVAADVVAVFERLYDARWPIRRMRPVSDFGSDDDRSMAANNTSAFNCRTVAGTSRWSDHAFGTAIDINPVQNPYLLDGAVLPPAGRRYAGLDRSARAPAPPGVITAGDLVVEAFASVGWAWGGTWTDPDYQHFWLPE